MGVATLPTCHHPAAWPSARVSGPLFLVWLHLSVTLQGYWLPLSMVEQLYDVVVADYFFSTSADMLQRSGCKPCGISLPSWASKLLSLEVSNARYNTAGLSCICSSQDSLCSTLSHAELCSSRKLVPKRKQLIPAQQQNNMTPLYRHALATLFHPQASRVLGWFDNVAL